MTSNAVELGRLRAIVFDFDGVILESADVKTDAFCELYRDHGDDVVGKVRTHHLANMGISRFKKFEWIAENILGAALTEDGKHALGTRFSDLCLAKVLSAPFVAGAETALATLAARYPLFVASGTPDEELKMICARRGVAAHFQGIHGTPREKPAIMRDLATRLGLAFDQFLFVGDGMSDYEAAIAVGSHFLARDTPALHDDWVRLGVQRVPDLTSLCERVSTW